MSTFPPSPPSGGAPAGGLKGFLSGRRGLALGAAAALALVAATAFALVGGDDGKVRVPDPSGIDGTYFGVHTKVERKSQSAKEAAIEALEDDLGRGLDIDHHFYPWDEEFPTGIERWDLSQGRLPMISWNGRGAHSADIAAGRHDPLIMDRAHRVKDLGETVLIRWFWEMDGSKKAEWAGAPADYVAAWRRIVDVFRAEGARNVEWVWCPNASAFKDGEAQAFYPGDEYVDWICGDGYNWAPGREGDEWRSFTEIFEAFYDWASTKRKPIMVGEYGVQERGPGEKAAWIADVQRVVKTEFPRMKAVVYFNANQDYDWRMDTSAAASEAFREMANDPWFAAALNRVPPE
ncbi:MAG TPA: glycosyl hydrolase [Acidimicrobiia bacterium]|nr:glycosyl hydrolase [Acidimicrobiia bacterium]